MLGKKVEKIQVGIFWGSDAFFLVATEKQRLLKMIRVPFNAPMPGGEEAQDVPDHLRLPAILQKGIHESSLSFKKVGLSLMAQDMIFRSFNIPWMQPNEMASVVEFEATKYIPIPLDQLSSTFHPVTYTENGKKKLRILFVAVRKDILIKQEEILERSGLQLEHIEPAPVSLTRLLQKQGILTASQVHALIEIGQDTGQVIIVDHDVVHFVREFPIAPERQDPASRKAKLFNDIRVSLDFYTRQSPAGKIDRIIAISAEGLPSLSRTLKDELNIPVTHVSTESLLKKEGAYDIGLLSAYGMALRDRAFSTKNFDLAGQGAKETGQHLAGQIGKYKSAALTAVVCLGVIAATILGTHVLSASARRDLAELKVTHGKYASLSTTDIDKTTGEIRVKLKKYYGVRLRSNMAYYLATIPDLLPKHAWLTSLTVDYYHPTKGAADQGPAMSRPSLLLNGLVYLNDANEQFRLVNSIVPQLKEAKKFAGAFSTITLANVGRQFIRGSKKNYDVTSFTIECK